MIRYLRRLKRTLRVFLLIQIISFVQPKKKIRIEPYVHLSTMDVSKMFGPQEAYKKVLFNDWWKKEADYSKDYETLQNEFNLKIEQNDSSSRPVPTEPEE